MSDADELLPSINLFFRNGKVEKIFSSSKSSHCTKCWKFGHSFHQCPSLNPSCPFCWLHHTKAEHRCPNTSCPKGGNLKPVLSCCPLLVVSCPNCQEELSVRTRDSPLAQRSLRIDSVHSLDRRWTIMTLLRTRLACQHLRAQCQMLSTPIQTLRTCILPRTAPPSKPEPSRVIKDLLPREASDESIDSDSSVVSYQ